MKKANLDWRQEYKKRVLENDAFGINAEGNIFSFLKKVEFLGGAVAIKNYYSATVDLDYLHDPKELLIFIVTNGNYSHCDYSASNNYLTLEWRF
jgi:hypothetical protein